MPKPLGVTFTQVYGSVADELIRRIGDPMAVQSGPPVASDIEPAGDTERVKAWNARNPKATDDAMRQLAYHKYNEHRLNGMDDLTAQRATAEDLTHFRYDQRVHLYTYGQVDFSEQVKEAKRIAALAARESTPNPLPPAPSMPSAALTTLATTQGLSPSPAPPIALGSVSALLGAAPPAPGQTGAVPPPPPTPAPGGYSS